MFILRSVTLDDLDDLFELSGKVQFINLPHDRDIIEKKITASVECFKKPHKNLWENYYFFVLEDIEKDKVIGVSMIHAQHGTPDEPHFFLKVTNEHKYSQTINTGFVHGMLKLGLEYDGPTEIGGLVVDPDYRGNKEKLGKQISFVRFLYMAQNPNRFKEIIHSELMPPLDAEGNSILWEALGRRFMNMNYAQADILSRSNKEFILSLFPTENIYMTLLSPEARNAIGKVGEDTLPVQRMLERIGFEYINEVDPFDGGPHYRAKLKEITLVKNYKSLTAIGSNQIPDDSKDFLLAFKNEKYDFFAIKVPAFISGDSISIDRVTMDKFDLRDNDKVSVIPF